MGALYLHPQRLKPAWEHVTSVAAGSGVSSGVPALADPQELLPTRPGSRIRARLHGPEGDQAGSNRQGETPQAQWRHTSREGNVQGLCTPLPGAGWVIQPVLLSFLWPAASSILPSALGSHRHNHDPSPHQGLLTAIHSCLLASQEQDPALGWGSGQRSQVTHLSSFCVSKRPQGPACQGELW